MGGRTSKEKGKRGEREIAKILRDAGYDTKRGQQFCGINGDADVIGLPHIHIEVKRVERLNIYDAMSQSIRDAKAYEMPTVMHRTNNRDWLVTMPLDEWLKIYKESVYGQC